MTTNNNMKTLHESKNPAYEPSNNCNIHLISKCNKEIDSKYYWLYIRFDLANREVFDFVDLNLYASNDPIKKHNFIRDIQLSIPTGLYRWNSFFFKIYTWSFLIIINKFIDFNLFKFIIINFF